MDIYSVILNSSDEEIQEFCNNKNKLLDIIKNSSSEEQFKAFKHLVLSKKKIFLEVGEYIISLIIMKGTLFTLDSIDIVLKNKWSFLLSLCIQENVELTKIVLGCIEKLDLDKDKKILLLNKSNKHGFVPLHFSVRMESTDITELLLKAGADPNGGAERKIYPPIKQAIALESKEQVRLLLDYGADLNFYEDNGFHFIYPILRFANKEMILLLFEHQPEIIRIKSPHNNLPLIAVAVSYKNGASVKLLLELLKSDKELVGKWRWRNFYAIKKSRISFLDEMLFLLKAQWPNKIISRLDENDLTLLEWAIRFNISIVVTQLFETVKIEELVDITTDNSLLLENAIELLCDNWEQILKIKLDKRYTILHWAIQLPCKENIGFLINRFLEKELVKIDVIDYRGKTPFMWAVERDLFVIAESLLSEHNANINWQDKKGYTALHHAVIREDVEGLKFLLSKNNIDIKSRNKKEETALELAVRLNHKKTAKILKSYLFTHNRYSSEKSLPFFGGFFRNFFDSSKYDNYEYSLIEENLKRKLD